MKNLGNKGISVIEILVVIAILAILISVVLPQFKTMRENEILKSTTSDVASLIDKARSESLSSVNSLEYGVHFEEDSVTIFQGMVYGAGTASNVVVPIDPSATITDISLSPSGSNLYFDRLSGEPSKTGTITIEVGALSKTVTISPTGAVSTN